MASDFQADIDAIGRIAAVPTILEVVCRTTGMGFAAVARVTEDRWIACGVRDEIAFGLKPGGELKIETTICNEIRQSFEPVVINHVAESAVYCRHPTPAMYGFQSYISMPIVLSNGTFFGTLCAIDPRPAKVETPETIGMFKLFAELIAFHLDAVQRVAASEATLLDERKTAEERTPLGERGMRLARLIQTSTGRIADLTGNLLDFARGRLGGGIPIARKPEILGPVLAHVVSEFRASQPDRTIDAAFALPGPVDCDPGRIAQLFSNLLANALAHGTADAPVRVRSGSAGGVFELSVANAGAPIPPSVQEQLFQPFFRAAAQTGEGGLGLGLYIASQIAKAHGGSLTVASSPEETRFTFRMPLAA